MNRLKIIQQIVRGLGLFTGLSLLAAFINFIFGFVMIRLLNAEEFRDLTLANNLINIFGNIFVALNVLGIAVFYLDKDHQAIVIRACQKILYILYASLLVVCIAFNGFVRERTGIDDALVLNLTLFIILCSIPVMALNATYIGIGRFTRSGVMNVVLAAGRLLFGVVGALIVAAHKDASSLAGILLIYVVAFSAFLLLDSANNRHQSMQVFRGVWQTSVSILGKYKKVVFGSLTYAIAISFLLGLDLLMFGRHFSNAVSADYAAVSVIGKLVFFFFMPVSLYLAGKQQAVAAQGQHFAKRVSLGVTALVAAAVIILISLPAGLYVALLHRPAASIDDSLLTLSIVFNGAVALLNHHLVEAIVRKRPVLAGVASALLLIAGAILFATFGSFASGSLYDKSLLALGLPATLITVGSLILYINTHLTRKHSETLGS